MISRYISNSALGTRRSRAWAVTLTALLIVGCRGVASDPEARCEGVTPTLLDEGANPSLLGPGEWEKRSAAMANGFSLPYHTFHPGAPSPEAGYPLVLALHGTTELIDFRGPDSHLEYREIVRGWASSAIQERYGPYVLAPQGLSTEMSWDNPFVLDTLNGLIQELIRRGVVDERRVYITGHSLGGMGTWYIPVYFHEQGFETRFAAMAPMAGFWYDSADVRYRGLEEATREVYVDLPMWVFHHLFDDVLSARGIIDGLERESLSVVRNDRPACTETTDRYIYTEYTQHTLPCSGVTCHRVCDTAVFDPYFLEWLFRQRRPYS